jgi:hypothetical protein
VRGRGLFLSLCLTACARDPVEAVCPAIVEGDLVVSEVRGPQSPDDANGPWVELFNATGTSIDLEGIKVRFRRKDGSSEIPILVRRSLVVAGGEYVVLGLFTDGQQPDHVDYGFLDDFAGSWLAAAAIQIDTCGQRVDVAVYDVLPGTGTFSLGIDPPDSTSNDLPASWCTDPMSPGTPGAANAVCP